MQRREFIALLGSTAAFPSVSLSAQNHTSTQMINSFLECFPIVKDKMGFFIVSKDIQKIDNEFEGEFYQAISFSIEKECASAREDIEVLLEKVFDNSEDFGKVDDAKPIVFSIERAANRISRESKRGRGNNIAFLDNGVLVWYHGESMHDTPIQVSDEDVILNTKAESYFKFLKVDMDDEVVEEIKVMVDAMNDPEKTYKRFTVHDFRTT